ncbi:MAG: amidohydrolase [SAR202 cluster bacterium]|jgi:amidohydrolase|nr:amidohydrolase [SAR202 cluster bacterium]
MLLSDTKQAVYNEIDRRGDEAIQIAKEVLVNPEPGFREYKTASIIADKLRHLGIPFQEGIAMTGLKGILETGRPGPTVAIIGELDSHIVRGHSNADPQTDAAHACAHHTQLGMLIAVAIGLQTPGIMENLSGRIALIAVPAEEYIEIEYRNDLRKQGKIEFLVGKSEFIKLGAFDDVDLAMMTHADNSMGHEKFNVGGTFNAMVAKQIRFVGLSAHAGSEPHVGINALNAATLALNAIHAHRETFRNEDYIRVHPIITRGGGAVSAVPDDVRIETFIRGRTIDAVLSVCKKIDRALRAGAMAMDATVEITTLPGVLPLQNDISFQNLHTSNVDQLLGKGNTRPRGHETGSSDMGDLSSIMPIIHPFIASATGRSHGVDYLVHDYDLGVLTPAKSMAATVLDLLSDGAKQAREIARSYNAPLERTDYLSTVRGFASEETFRG